MKTPSNKIDRKKVYVGLSGGVDSSVSATLLLKEGYDVTGVFIKTWHPDFLPCTWKEDRLDAMRVAAHLGIPFKTYDFEKEYKKEVADSMIDDYRQGRTPNPDVMCNKHVKFGAFYEKALSDGADFIATGHYARVFSKIKHGKSEIRNPKSENKKAGYMLLAGKDKEKDQSYFLWTLGQNELKNILFPIGKYQKSEVRILAKKFGLPTAEKKDSQGICFLGSVDMKDFLKRSITLNPGDVLNPDGNIIGYHDGAVLYTLGQRHGFVIQKKGVSDEPLYVVDKDMQKNTLTVSKEIKSQSNETGTYECHFHSNHWISRPPQRGKTYQARFRYRQALQECEIHKTAKGYQCVFKTLQERPSSGQSLVVYEKDACLGGGIIDR